MKISSTSVADKFECTIPKKPDDIFVPWVEVHGDQNVTVNLTGCEAIQTRDCRDFFDKSQTSDVWNTNKDGVKVTAQNDIVEETLTSYTSLPNTNGNYKVNL